MKYRRTRRFKRAYKQLKPAIQDLCPSKFLLLKENPFHPSLNIKKMGGRDIWEGRINMDIRFTFEIVRENGEEVLLFRNIGPHDKTLSNP